MVKAVPRIAVGGDSVDGGEGVSTQSEVSSRRCREKHGDLSLIHLRLPLRHGAWR